MKDRFKFRAYLKDENIIIDDFFICPDRNSIIQDEFCVDFISLPMEYKLEDIILMQCTGLKDKNGKLIYEGDVVTYEWLTSISKVWRNDGKEIVKWTNGFVAIGNIAGYNVEHGTSRNVEIIGNIYENKDLLNA